MEKTPALTLRVIIHATILRVSTRFDSRPDRWSGAGLLRIWHSIAVLPPDKQVFLFRPWSSLWHPAQRGRANPAAKNGKDGNGIFVCSNSGPLSPELFASKAFYCSQSNREQFGGEGRGEGADITRNLCPEMGAPTPRASRSPWQLSPRHQAPLRWKSGSPSSLTLRLSRAVSHLWQSTSS